MYLQLPCYIQYNRNPSDADLNFDSLYVKQQLAKTKTQSLFQATGNSYQGHSSHVTMAKFLCDDSRVISTGGKDETVMQWQVVA
ncbi:hypothetical protein DPMN_102006 [Dreissena polymorpha]|uniref:Uncharacterized protein n=1 Tax=Dreissena polymorpha TaxID=45954 RepID=A0A9D4R9K4_DREPO|nr:hypothetical protein DPMN_102006 [Dreissena polymorpha]